MTKRLACTLFHDNLIYAGKAVASAKAQSDIFAARFAMRLALGYMRQALQRANETGDAGRKALAFAMFNKVRAQAHMIGA